MAEKNEWDAESEAKNSYEEAWKQDLDKVREKEKAQEADPPPESEKNESDAESEKTLSDHDPLLKRQADEELDHEPPLKRQAKSIILNKKGWMRVAWTSGPARYWVRKDENTGKLGKWAWLGPNPPRTTDLLVAV